MRLVRHHLIALALVLGPLMPAAACVGQLGSVEAASESGSADQGGVDLCPCDAPEVCSFGYCTDPPFDADCEAGDPTDTVCPSDAVCFGLEETTNACYPMPDCPEDGVCPIGEFGAVCNEGGYPTKDRICLVGVCDGQEHCPSDANCVHPGLGYGLCSFGGWGEACTEDAHCNDPYACTVLPGGIGFCG